MFGTSTMPMTEGARIGPTRIFRMQAIITGLMAATLFLATAMRNGFLGRSTSAVLFAARMRRTIWRQLNNSRRIFSIEPRFFSADASVRLFNPGGASFSQASGLIRTSDLRNLASNDLPSFGDTACARVCRALKTFPIGASRDNVRHRERRQFRDLMPALSESCP